MRILKFFLTICCFWFIPFQLPAQDYWAGLSEVHYDGKNFYAVANQFYQVVKLDKKGEVLATFGKRGRGPREFMSDKLELLLVDSLLYILDDRAMHITTLDKKKFKSIDRKTIKKPSSDLILYRENLYGYVTDFEESNPFKTGKQANAFREIDKLKNPKSTLFKISDENPINPFYDGEKIYFSNGHVIVIREGKKRFTIFDGNTLYRRDIPHIEKIAVGEKIDDKTGFLERPEAKVFWKKKIMPEYELINAAYLEGDVLYIQLHSYKLGDSIVKYNLKSDDFNLIGTLSQGRLIATDNNLLYTLNNNEIDSTFFEDVRRCANDPVTFYFSADAFEEQCTTCKDSFFEWFDYVEQNNIPVKIILEDDSWFGRKKIDADLLKKINQWDIWGEMNYTKDCDDCFNSSLSVKISNSNKLYSLPESLPTLKNELDCVAE